MSFVANGSCVESLPVITAPHEDRIIRKAIALLEKRVFTVEPSLNNPSAVRDYLRLKLVAEPDELFVVVFMNTQHQVLACEPLFRGTIDSATVHPRTIVRRALDLNAAAVVFAHQHPSGSTKPSSADCALTQRLQASLALIDVRVLDHIVIGRGKPYSFAESGLL
ncbi:DNA repair protein RadC [Pseudomonas aeruginosa]|uniref:DNA repair protein RadC n=1 Tax=Azoarcus taiwanensis TaxID=666964 RepID=A0A972FIF4_9RHOO|nr:MULTISPECIES: DNA repair protein RadC [Pseudomonadota]EDT3379597.1 DNA repair protein RadC [Salmonella enterica subsp. enterica serovar Mbandaka]EDU8579603.1 DNA repair protein RadC [Salmonella enterica subsp. enterica serovar Mbandaka]EDV5274781.1 DNA repair protein RadC [Salmonella enterica subsp. enterica serovar Mbandaka]MDM7357311.1 DNA repair protein RadC [Klebsiella pneumoniae]MDV2646515.1 DNA repair protein RadC [Pseudomonas aeruginosa]